MLHLNRSYPTLGLPPQESATGSLGSSWALLGENKWPHTPKPRPDIYPVRFRNIESGYFLAGPASGTRVKLNLLRNLTSQKTYVTRAFAPDLFVSDSLLTYWSWRRRIYILASCIIDYSTQLLPLHHRTSALATYRNTRNLVAQSSGYSP